MNVILHIGLGAFHRAHQAVYLQRLHDLGQRDWTIVAGNLRPDMLPLEQALIASGGEYTVHSVAPGGARQRQRIRCIRRVLSFDPQWHELIAVGADPSTRIISMTVTEGGYGDGAPIYDVIEAILERRRGQPVTVLSCDNLRGNGDRLRARFAGANATFPNSMVDRITPKPAGGTDVTCEQFMQWVLEDRFAAGRPEWERVGALFAPSVIPYEEAKIRILNASHSALAWAGALRGHAFIHECAADPAILGLAHAHVTEEVIPCLAPSPLDLAEYRDQVLERFRNAALQDTVQRVAGGSASKVRTFILPTLLDRLRAGAPIRRSAALAALFFRYLERWCAGGLAFEHTDPELNIEEARRLFAHADPLGAFGSLAMLWGEAAGDARFLLALRAEG